MSATPNIRGEKIFGSITGITLFSATTISGGTLYGDGSNLSGIIGGSGSSITGGTFDKNTSTLTFTNTSGGTFSVTGLTDIYTTGLTFNQSTYDLTIRLNDNSSVTQNLSVLASDVTITGGTYNPSNGIATFTNNTGGTFNVSGFLTGFTDIYTTGGTYDNGAKTILFTRNDNNTYSVNLSSITSQDVYVSGGTYDNNTGTATFTNTSGGTFNVSGFTTGGTSNVVASAITYDNSISNLSATTVQNAIDEIVSKTPIVLAQSSPNSVRSGDTNNTLMYSKLIYANMVGVGDCIKIITKFTKPSGSVANPTIRLYINTSSDLSGASLLATYATNNLNGRFFIVDRVANVDGVTTNFFTTTSGALTDSNTLFTAAASSEVSIDWTINQYFIVAIQLGNAADSTTLRMVNVILDKNI